MHKERTTKWQRYCVRICAHCLEYAKVKIGKKAQKGYFLIMDRECQGALGHQISKTSEEHQGQIFRMPGCVQLYDLWIVRCFDE